MPDIPITDIDTLFGVLPGSDLDTSLPFLLSLMDKHHIRQALTYSLSALQFDAPQGNDDAWQAHQQHPQLSPMAVIDPRLYIGCEEEIARRAEQGFAGFRFFPRGWALDGLHFQQLLRAVSRTGKPVIVQAGGAGEPTRLYRTAEGITTPIILSGIGYSTLGEALAVVAATPNFYLQMHTITQPFQVELTIEKTGVERLLFGSMAPMQYIRPSLKMIEYAEISDQDRARILGGNARRLFGLPEPEVQA